MRGPRDHTRLEGGTDMEATGRPFYRTLYFWVLVGIALGVGVGWAFPAFGAGLKPLGDAFIKLVKMIITPVIFLTVVAGIAGMSDLKSFGRIGLKAMAYFLFFSTLALIIGLIVANLVRPGHGLDIDPRTLDHGKIADYVSQAHDQTVVGFLMHIIPTTPFSAFSEGDVLQVLFFAILFGIALAMLGERGERIATALKALGEVVFRIVHILMYAAPLGAFGAMAFTVGNYGIAALANLAALVACFYLTAILFVLVVLGAVARLTGFSILRLIRYIRAELLLVLGTSSSESAMPLLIEKLERAGCPKTIVGLVVPAGYSFNLDGTNIYMTMAALFIAQATNTDLTLGQEILLLLVAMLSSKGAAGVTGSGFVTLAATLSVVPTVPVAGMALILGVDRFMSECRALTNFIGNAVATFVVSRWEGALDEEKMRAALGR